MLTCLQVSLVQPPETPDTVHHLQTNTKHELLAALTWREAPVVAVSREELATLRDKGSLGSSVLVVCG